MEKLSENNDRIEDSKCFQGLFPEEKSFITNKKIQVKYLKGENIFKQGAFAPYVLYVVDGLVKVYLQLAPDKQINLQVARKGDYLAFSSIFDTEIHTYSGVALKDTTICMIDRLALRKLFLQNSEFAMKMTSRNCRLEKNYLNIIRNISYNQMRGKLATSLLYLSSEELLEEKIFTFLTRQDIADFASITTESAIKYLKEFEKDGIIELKGKEISIFDRERLELLSKNS